MLYFPPVFTSTRAEELGRAARLERWSDASGQPIGWKRSSPIQPSQGQVLLLHGNGIAAVQCEHYADAIQQAAAFDVFIVEYPGYADQGGKPSETALEISANQAFHALATNRPIFLVGESLGTGVASYLAGTHGNRVAGVALFAPYNNLTDVAQAHVRIVPVNLMLCDRFPADDHLAWYRGPVAMLVFGKDRIVPARFGRRLFEGYGGAKRLWEFPDGNHGSLTKQTPELWKQIIDFWQAHPSGSIRFNAIPD